MSTAQAATTLHPLVQEIRNRLELAGDLSARLDRPNLPAARDSLAVFQECFRLLSAHADVDSGIARLVDAEALYRSFDAFLGFRLPEPGLTAAALIEAWMSAGSKQLADLFPIVFDLEALALDMDTIRDALARSASVGVKELAGSPDDYHEWLVLFHQAVEQVITSELGADQARTALRSLCTRLELSQDDLGRMFRVSGETIRRWERGLTTVPTDRRSEILAAEAALRRLQDLFRPERLPMAVRRPAELFNGESALEWILRGLIVEVADRYERALLYQA